MNSENHTSPRKIGDLSVVGGSALSLLVSMSEDDRAHCFVQMNSWEWPDALSAAKPDGWDNMGHAEKQKEGKWLWNLLEKTVSDFAFSRQWHREKCENTDEKHFEWWVKTYLANGADQPRPRE